MCRSVLAGLLLLAFAMPAHAQGPAPAAPAANEPPRRPEHPHSAQIYGVRVGMTAQDVLERLGRMPDRREDKNGEIVCTWKLPNNDVLQVVFRNENFVARAMLQFRPVRPLNDFGLRAFGEAKLKDPRALSDAPLPVAAGAGSSPGSTGSASLPEAYGSNPTQRAGDPATTRKPIGKEQRTVADVPDPREARIFHEVSTLEQDRKAFNREEKSPAGYSVTVSFLTASNNTHGANYDSFVEYKYVMVKQADLKKFDAAVTGKK